MTGRLFLSVAALTAGACSGSGEGRQVDAGDEPPAAIAGLDTGFGTQGLKAVPLSAADGDRLVTVVAGKDGKTYASGYVAQAGDHAMAVARFDAAGALDTTFSGNGVATVNVAVGGRAVEIGRGLGLQSSGKVVSGGPSNTIPRLPGTPPRTPTSPSLASTRPARWTPRSGRPERLGSTSACAPPCRTRSTSAT